MTCKEYKDRDIVYHCKAHRNGDRYVCECGLDEPYTRTDWEDLTQEERNKIMDNIAARDAQRKDPSEPLPLELEEFTPNLADYPRLPELEKNADGYLQFKSSSAPKFYLVFNPQQSAPKYQHKTIEEAKTEAKRIAAKYPKQKFYVLETVACYTASVDVQEVGVA